jgi:hypothetical protein
MMTVLKKQEPFDNERFCAELARLPQLPWKEEPNKRKRKKIQARRN